MEQRKIIRKKFNFELTDKEKAKRAMELADMTNLLHLMEADFFGVKKDYMIRIKEMREKLMRLTKLISIGTEEREVDVEEIFNHDEEKVSYLYKGKIIQTRDMTDEERQLSMVLYPPFAEPEKYTPVNKPCMTCGEKFTSRHKFHRICEGCAKLEAHKFAGGA